MRQIFRGERGSQTSSIVHQNCPIPATILLTYSPMLQDTLQKPTNRLFYKCRTTDYNSVGLDFRVFCDPPTTRRQRILGEIGKPEYSAMSNACQPVSPRKTLTRRKRFVFNPVRQCVSCVSKIIVATKRLIAFAITGNSHMSQINDLTPTRPSQLTRY